MIKELEFLEETLKQNVGTVVVVGAGSGSDLDEIIALQPDFLVCIEANKQLAASLERRTKKLGNVRIVNEWVTAGSEPVNVFEFSNPRYNSLSAPSEKLKSRPNLKLMANNQLSGKAFAELLSELPLSKEKINLLIFSVPGSEKMLIQNAAENLYAFDYVLIDPKNSDCYATPWEIKEKVEGFNLTNFNLNENRVTHFLYSRNISREKKLQRELNSIKAEHQKECESLQTKKEEVQSLQKQLQQAQQQVSNLEEENKKSEEQLKQQCIRHEDEKQSWLSEVKKLKDERTQEAVVLKTTSKLNLKLQADLDNIRGQYSKKIQAEKELTNLISELYVKLKQASEFYDRLEENYPEIARKVDE
ncbi:hypothetical protein ACI7YQ_16815 [Alteromonas marina]